MNLKNVFVTVEYRRGPSTENLNRYIKNQSIKPLVEYPPDSDVWSYEAFRVPNKLMLSDVYRVLVPEGNGVQLDKPFGYKNWKYKRKRHIPRRN